MSVITPAQEPSPCKGRPKPRLRNGLAMLSIAYVLLTILTAAASQKRLFGGIASDYVSGDVLLWMSDAEANGKRPFRHTHGDPYSNLYMDFMSNISPLLIPLLNIGAVIATIFMLGACGRILGRRVAVLTAAFIALNPLFWMSALGPCKEPSLVCLASISLSLVMRTRIPWTLWVFGGIMAAPALLYRMEFSVAVAAGTGLILLIRTVGFERRIPGILMCGALCGMLLIPALMTKSEVTRGRSVTDATFEKFSTVAPSETGAASVEISRRLMESTWTAPIGVIYRLGVSIVRAPLRPAVRMSDGRLALYPFFLWINEFLVTLGLTAGILILLGPKPVHESGKIVAAFTWAIGVLIGCYPIVQTRYFMALAPFLLILVFMLESRKRMLLVKATCALAVIGPITLALLGHPPAVNENTDLPMEGNLYLNPVISGSNTGE